MAEKTIYIVEGPAGAGKSTFLEHWPDLVVSIKSGDRSYSNHFPSLHAAFEKDLAALAQCLGILRKKSFVFMDRGFLSHRVYTSIRTGEQKVGIVSALAEAQELLRALMTGLYYRGFFIPEDVRIVFVVLLPLPSLIKRFRFQSPKEYAYSADLEFQKYHQLAGEMPKRHVYVLDTPATYKQDFNYYREYNND